MKTWVKCLMCISLSLMCMLTCVGYAAVSGNLSISGTVSATAAPPSYDVYISSVTPNAGAGIKIKNTAGTLLTATVSGAGSATFTVEVTNVSSQAYVYERTIDGAEVGIDGVYSGMEITYQISNIAPMDELAPGSKRVFYVTVNVPEGISTDSYMLKFNFVEKYPTPGEEYFPEDMSRSAVDLAQRVHDIINNKYTVPNTTKTARDYLLNDTIREKWGGESWAAEFVGNIDERYKVQFEALFGDLELDPDMKFILKEQDLIGDWVNEIAIYSTYDKLDSFETWGGYGVVCVYVTVFKPVYDAWWNVVGYEIAGPAVRGYCYEVMYNTDYQIPSFSTDDWRSDVGFIHHWEGDVPIKYSIPDETPSVSGKPVSYKEDFDSYNLIYEYEGTRYYTTPYGQTISEWLQANQP